MTDNEDMHKLNIMLAIGALFDFSLLRIGTGQFLPSDNDNTD
jgi:hypothetical protein